MQRNFIANESVVSASGRSIPVLDPSDGQVFDELQRSDATDIDAAVAAARASADTGWGRLTAAERGRMLTRLSQSVAAHVDELALLEQRDCGKPVKQARADATALARYFEFYAGACDKLHGETLPYLDGYSVFTWREPHGVTGHIIPWNYPMQIFGRSVGGALAAGNTCVVKPAEDACLSLIRVAQLAAEIGFPAGTINIVTGYGHEVGDALARHPGIDHISFTGSPKIGTLIQQVAAERHCPVTLELGGKSPQIVFADADLDAVLPTVINAIVQNAGQTCSAGSPAAGRAVHLRAAARAPGQARLPRCAPARPRMDLDLGPLIRQSQLSAGRRVPRRRRPATASPPWPRARSSPRRRPPASTRRRRCCATCRSTHRLAQEEVFGPVLAAMAFDDEDQARGAGQRAPQFGLVAGVWTRDGARQFRMARRRAQRPGLHQQLRRRRRRRAAVRRRQVIRLRPRKGLRGAVRLHDAQDRGRSPRLNSPERFATPRHV